MFEISSSVCIDAPVSTVWQILSDLESIHVWVQPIRHSYCEGDLNRGLNAVRVCELGGNITVKETIVEWVEGKAFAYAGEGAPLMKRAINRWSVEERGSQTLVTSSAEVVLKGRIFGRLLDPLFAAVARGMGARSLAALKFFVENGRPFAGNARKLLPIPTAC
jgi:carbon monoxide dehydrogenase subunit G